MRGKLTAIQIIFALIGITPAGAGKTFRFAHGIVPKQDHPRRCGENKDAGFRATGSPGSPPRMRGRPCSACTGFCTCGITPADAGKTHTCSVFNVQLQDHPRGCGENLNQHSDKRLRRGSPPQVRGKPIFAVANFVPPGITPAGAGKTSCHGLHASDGRDHPRRCGENEINYRTLKRGGGSPPQVRGKL